MSEQQSSERRTKVSEPYTRPLWRTIRTPTLVLLVALLAWWGVVSSETPRPTSTPTPPTHKVVSGRVLREAFYEKQIEPLLKETARANQRAADRAVLRITEMFDKYRAGIKPFTGDITSIGARFGVLRRMPANWWYEDERINAYILVKFETHFFSEDQFHQDIMKVFEALKDDLRANENRLLAACKAAIESGDLPDLTLPEYKQYEDDVHKVILQFGGDRAKDSVYHGIATLILSEVAVITVQQIAVRILVSVGTTAATSAAASGGAAAAGAASGGAAGTLGGPVGTAIGVGAGLVVGIIVDWWMTDRFKERLAIDLNDYLDELEYGLLDGTGTDEGLRKPLMKFVDDLSFAQNIVVNRELAGAQ